MKTLFKFSLFVITLLTLPSCACWKPEHRNDPQCAIIHGIVDCTESSVIALLPQFKPVVQQLIAEATGADGKVDWTVVEKGFGALGVKDGGCILADIEKDYLESTPPGAPPEQLAARASFKANFDTYRAKKWPGVKFRVLKSDGAAVLL